MIAQISTGVYQVSVTDQKNPHSPKKVGMVGEFILDKSLLRSCCFKTMSGSAAGMRLMSISMAMIK